MSMPYSAKCDVWSAGSLIYFLTFGKHPFLDLTVHNTLLKIQEMTMNKNLDLPLETDLTISKILQMTLKYEEK